MKAFLKKLPKSQVELRIEIPVEEFETFIEKAILDLGKDLEVEGFRKGKAPEEIVLKLFIFKVNFSVLSKIKLPDYRKITSEIKRRKVSVKKEEIENVIKQLKFSRSNLTLKDGPAQIGVKYFKDRKKIAKEYKRRLEKLTASKEPKTFREPKKKGDKN